VSDIIKGFLDFGGPWAALVALGIIGIGLGWLETPRGLRRIEADHALLVAAEQRRTDDERARGDEYREAWKAEKQRNDLLARNMDELLELSRTSRAIIESLRAAATARGAD
jgi:hypothetical protein